MIYGKATYEVNEWFNPYVEGQFINNKVPTQLAPTPIGNSTPGVVVAWQSAGSRLFPVRLCGDAGELAGGRRGPGERQ